MNLELNYLNDSSNFRSAAVSRGWLWIQWGKATQWLAVCKRNEGGKVERNSLNLINDWNCQLLLLSRLWNLLHCDWEDSLMTCWLIERVIKNLWGLGWSGELLIYFLSNEEIKSNHSISFNVDDTINCLPK